MREILMYGTLICGILSIIGIVMTSIWGFIKLIKWIYKNND